MKRVDIKRMSQRFKGACAKKVLLLLLTIIMLIAPVAATCNIVIITDPTGKDPNGAAAGSMSFQQNMFQSTFLSSPNDHFAVLSGGEGASIPRLQAIVASTQALKSGATPSQAASLANNYGGIRIMVGNPTQGAAVGGYFQVYVVMVEDNGTITVTPYSGGLATLPPGKKGAIIHLLNTPGNPMYGTAETVRRETAVNMGKMIRDGYPATKVLEEAFKEVSVDAGEKYGGGGVNLVSSISTGDMFTPEKLNTTGYPMNTPYSKVCPTDGWSIGYPGADSYTTCPIDGSRLNVKYAYDALGDAITVTSKTVQVSVYGTDEIGIKETTQEIVKASIKKHGYSNIEIAKSINRGIDNGLLVGVNYVEPKDINVKPSSRAVGVYFKPLPDKRSSPSWDLPVSSSLLDIIGNMQTAIGIILVLLVLFRSTLISSFLKK